MKFNFSFYKRLFVIVGILLFMVPQSIVAQQEKPKNLLLYDTQPYHFGFIIALNQMSYSIDYKEDYQLVLHDPDEFINDGDYNRPSNPTYVRSINPEPHYGFTVGVVGNLRLGKYFDLRLIPTLSFGTRIVEYQIYETVTEINPYQTFKKSVFSTFMEFPLLVKYKSKRHNNFAAYLIGGGNFKVDLASQKRETSSEGVKNIKLNRSDLAAEIGAGVDFYTGYFKFGIEAKMSFGLLNILDAQGLFYDTSINSLHNRMFQLSLTFE